MPKSTSATRAPLGHESSVVAVAPIVTVGVIVLLGAVLLASVVYAVIDHSRSPERNARTSALDAVPAPQLQPQPGLDKQRYDDQQRRKRIGVGNTHGETAPDSGASAARARDVSEDGAP